MSGTGFADYRLFRDDYTELQSLYIEAFEVTSKLLAFLGSCLNLANRGAANLWSNGSTRTLSWFLQQTASQREFISFELTSFRIFIQEMDRHLRNCFGHYNVRYEPRDGYFHDRTAKLNAIEFHIDYLNHIRVLDIFLTFARRIVSDMKRKGII